MAFPAVIKYPVPSRISLFGGTPLMGAFYNALLKKYPDIPVYAHTAPRQANDCGDIPSEALEVTEDIDATLPRSAIEEAEIGIAIGEAWKFGPEIRAGFGDRLVAFMSIPYPNYLGGAHTTHAVLRGEKHWGCCMQLITENTEPGEIHDGAVIYGHMMDFEDREKHYLPFLMRFLDLIVHDCAFRITGTGFPTTYPSNLPRRFYPRLNTEKQGWIDWSWDREQIVRFILAFDDPHPGARTMIGSTVVTLHLIGDQAFHEDAHPFHNGLIVDRFGDEVPRFEIMCSDGAIWCEPRSAGGVDWITPGMRLHTPRPILDAALTYTPCYTPTGDANAH